MGLIGRVALYSRDTRGHLLSVVQHGWYFENCFCLLLCLDGPEECDPRTREHVVYQLPILELWYWRSESDRLKDICVSQSHRQNIDLVGMKAGPRDAEELRHSRVVGGSRWWAEW